MASKPIKIDILDMEMSQGLPHWLDPVERYKGTHDNARKQKHDAYQAELKAKLQADNKKKAWQRASDEARRGLLKAKLWDESQHPRVPAGGPGGGQFGEGGGGGSSSDGGGQDTAGYEFISPNVRSDLNFKGAVDAISSDQQVALREASSEINKGLGHDAHQYNIVGAWADGAENSVMDIADKSDWDTLVASAAMKAHLADQKQVLVFQNGQGNSALYSFQAKGDLQTIHENLLKQGLAFHTLVPRAGGAQVYVADKDLTLQDTVAKAANGANVTVDIGRAEFLGTEKSDGTDREQRDDARRIYEEIISQSPVQGARSVWQGVRDTWGEAGQAVSSAPSSSPYAKDPKSASSLLNAENVSVESITSKIPGASQQIGLARTFLKHNAATSDPVAKGGHKLPNGQWTPQRLAVHADIITKVLTPQAVAAATPKSGEQPVLHILGGRGGSGKGWFTGKKGTFAKGPLNLNADDFKAALPEYRGWNAGLLHVESNAIGAAIEQKARDAGLNVIIDTTMQTGAVVEKRIAEFKAAGYRIEGHYMYASPATAARRATSRFVEGNQENGQGRFVPPEYSLGSVTNEHNFDKARSDMDAWEVYDNNIDGREPQFHSRGGK